MMQSCCRRFNKNFTCNSWCITNWTTGLREGAEARAGVIISDRLELAFKGINKRQFQYTFKMIPRSQAEADEIRKIIFSFKQNMLPEFVGGNRQGRRLRVPNTFDIQYMYKGNSNEYLHHISTCVLETMNVHMVVIDIKLLKQSR